MSEQHTPTPWLPIEAHDCHVSVMRSHRGGTWTCIEGDHAGDKIIGVTETDYRRAMVCVNACEGIPTDYLESPDNEATQIAKRGYSEIIALRQQRDQLLTAIKLAVSEAVADSLDDWYANAQSVIAAVEGKE